MRRGNLFVISGPSGVGKGTLVSRVVSKVDDAWLSVSATTRKPRDGETDGQQYFFVTVSQFEDMIARGELLEWARYSGNYYGTPAASVREHMTQGQQVILEIDIQGARQVKRLMPEAHLIFIAPPSLEELERRLRGRGSDSEQAIVERLATARRELAGEDEYDLLLINDDLDETTTQLIRYIEDQAEVEV